MKSSEAPDFKKLYTSADLELLGFHDCHVSGVRWDPERFEVVLEMGYILSWIQPAPDEERYRFWVAPAELRFLNVSDLHLELSWPGLVLDCSIQDLHRQEERLTPNGSTEWFWDLELSEPDGSISLWATDFHLRIHDQPKLLDTPRLSRKSGQ